MDAAEMAEIEDLARENRSIGPGARELSQGQRQRSGLARAFARGARLMLLDEPFSAIESGVADALQARVLACNAAVVQVTHRLAGMERFDRICVMKEGRMIDAGTHAELLTRSELYRKLIYVLSGGERQRILIARGLVGNTAVLLLHEPTASLDALNEAEILKNLQSIARSGVLVIMATHRMSSTNYVDEVFKMEAGMLHPCKEYMVMVEYCNF